MNIFMGSFDHGLGDHDSQLSLEDAVLQANPIATGGTVLEVLWPFSKAHLSSVGDTLSQRTPEACLPDTA